MPQWQPVASSTTSLLSANPVTDTFKIHAQFKHLLPSTVKTLVKPPNFLVYVCASLLLFLSTLSPCKFDLHTMVLSTNLLCTFFLKPKSDHIAPPLNTLLKSQTLASSMRACRIYYHPHPITFLISSPAGLTLLQPQRSPCCP